MAQQQTSEDVLWEGGPSQLTSFGLYLVCTLTCVLIVPIFIALWRWIETRMTRYRLTSERLFFSTGVFSKQTEVIELYRVRDIRILEPFMLRMFGLGHVILDTSDKTTPVFTFRAIRGAAALADIVRQQTEKCRVAKRVREVDFE